MQKNIKKKIILIISGSISMILIVFLLFNFLLNNFSECHAENDACCKKLGGLISCTYVDMKCDKENEEPVWKGCDSDCKHIIECVEKKVSMFGDDTEIGKTCSIDSDCKLPMSYALRSDRRYDIKCIDFKCAIIDYEENRLKCCEECKTAFSQSPVGFGTEKASCGKFSSGELVSKKCKLFFENNPMSVSACKNLVKNK
ncbi:MAG: hypothetical protein KAI16_02115 [Candidatus Pacebacteria bacterium]|nr:hypothetical protein [Candidatus Paceibacterota bacterium]